MLHHFDLDEKVRVSKRIVRDLLVPNGLFIVGDISFPSSSARSEARKKLASEWDDYEYYWAADEFKEMIDGFSVVYEQVSDYGGVYLITR